MGREVTPCAAGVGWPCGSTAAAGAGTVTGMGWQIRLGRGCGCRLRAALPGLFLDSRVQNHRTCEAGAAPGRQVLAVPLCSWPSAAVPPALARQRCEASPEPRETKHREAAERPSAGTSELECLEGMGQH